MLLAIDCGNTNIVMSVFDGDLIFCQWRRETETSEQISEYREEMVRYLAQKSRKISDIRGPEYRLSYEIFGQGNAPFLHDIH